MIKLYQEAEARVMVLEGKLFRSMRPVVLKVNRWAATAHQQPFSAFKWIQLRNDLKAVMRPYFGLFFSTGVATAERVLGSAIAMKENPIELPAEFAWWYELTVDDALYRYTERLRLDISQAVVQNSIEGGSILDLTKTIKSLVNSAATWQAERIARTESMRLWNLGHFTRFEEVQEVVGYEYMVVRDGRTSLFCRPLIGVKVRREDLQKVPPLHPNCRTMLRPLFDFDEIDDDQWYTDPIASTKGFGTVPRFRLSVAA